MRAAPSRDDNHRDPRKRRVYVSDETVNDLSMAESDKVPQSIPEDRGVKMFGR